MEHFATAVPDEFAHFGIDNLLHGRVIVILRGYESSDPRHFHTNKRVGWALGASGRPVGAEQRMKRLMQFDSVADAHAWMRYHPLKKHAPGYSTGFIVEEEKRGRILMFEPAAWVDVERLKAKVESWNNHVAERAERAASAMAAADAIYPFLLTRGVRPRTASRIIRARLIQILDPEFEVGMLLSSKELEAMNESVEDERRQSAE